MLSSKAVGITTSLFLRINLSVLGSIKARKSIDGVPCIWGAMV
jgi:hypothetical protein